MNDENAMRSNVERETELHCGLADYLRTHHGHNDGAGARLYEVLSRVCADCTQCASEYIGPRGDLDSFRAQMDLSDPAHDKHGTAFDHDRATDGLEQHEPEEPRPESVVVPIFLDDDDYRNITTFDEPRVAIRVVGYYLGDNGRNIRDEVVARLRETFPEDLWVSRNVGDETKVCCEKYGQAPDTGEPGRHDSECWYIRRQSQNDLDIVARTTQGSTKNKGQ